jgi:SAM-dependent methyltransferase
VNDLLAEAEAHPFTGWDFSWLGERMTVTRPWDYREMVSELARAADALLDMGTGGGEFLLEMPSRPLRTFATEGWPPNVTLAGANLRTIGVPVVQDEGAADNVFQAGRDPRGRLPFRTRAFDVVVNRHEAFYAPEVARVLTPGGVFLTQQVDNGNLDDSYASLGMEVASPPSWLDVAVDQVETAGFTVLAAERGAETYTFTDAGAFAWYLKAVTPLHRDYPTFTIAEHRDTLAALPTPIVTTQRRFYVRAASRR